MQPRACRSASRLSLGGLSATLSILLVVGISCARKEPEPQRAATWGDALPVATQVVYDGPMHPPVVVELRDDGCVWADPAQVWLRTEGLPGDAKPGMQQVTLDELAVLLACARDRYRPENRETALEGAEGVSARGVLLRVHKDAPWQNVAWVAMIAAEARMWKLEFEVRDGTGKTGRFLAHEPLDPTGRPSPDWGNPLADEYAFRSARFTIEPHVEVEVAMVDGVPSWTVNGDPCAGPEDARLRLARVPERRAMPTMVRIAFSVPAGAGVGALDVVRAVGFERVWWAVNIPPGHVRKMKKLPPP